MYHSDLDLANFEAICAKTPPHSSLASSNFINSRTSRKDLCMMPNVYISLGVHGFFRDAPTTLNLVYLLDLSAFTCFLCLLSDLLNLLTLRNVVKN